MSLFFSFSFFFFFFSSFFFSYVPTRSIDYRGFPPLVYKAIVKKSRRRKKSLAQGGTYVYMYLPPRQVLLPLEFSLYIVVPSTPKLARFQKVQAKSPKKVSLSINSFLLSFYRVTLPMLPAYLPT